MPDLDTLTVGGTPAVTAEYKPVPAYEAGGGTIPKTALRGVVRQADDTPTALGEMNERLAALASRDEWLKAEIADARADAAADATAKAAAAETAAKAYADTQIRAWGRIAYDGTISAGKGLASCTRSGEGVYRLQLAETPPDARKVAVIVTAEVSEDLGFFFFGTARWDPPSAGVTVGGEPSRITIKFLLFEPTDTYTKPLFANTNFSIAVFW